MVGLQHLTGATPTAAVGAVQAFMMCMSTADPPPSVALQTLTDLAL